MAALGAGAAIVVCVAVAGCGDAPAAPAYDTTPVTFSITTTTPTSTVPLVATTPYPGPNGIAVETGPFLGSAVTTRLGQEVDGIQCQSFAQLAYTAYAHLQIYFHGRSRALPGGIGLVDQTPQATPHGYFWDPGPCMYWLHTRATDGVIEVQSPVPRTFTLGDFFAIWGQPLSGDQVASLHGPVTVTVNGKRWTQPAVDVPLTEHTDVELAVGSPVPRANPVDWLPSGL